MESDPTWTARHARRALGLTIAAILVGAVVLVVGMFEEPYHIDELRQVESYRQPFWTLIDLSFGQEQPPLDPILGKMVRRMVGEGHVQQRLHPTVLGVGSLVLLAMLLWGAGLRWGTAVAVLLYSIVPIVVGVTAYARQYALPVFLWLGFLVGAERWLRSRSRTGLAVVLGSAFLLPLSRSVEPLIFLGSVVVVLFAWHLRGRSWDGSIWPVMGGAIVSLVAVGLPVLLRFGSEASEFIAPQAGLVERIGRIFADLPFALADSAAVWPIALAAIAAAVATPRTRRLLRDGWWIWPLVAIPLGFAAAFFVLAKADQPFFLRYTYSWWLPAAILVGAGTEWAVGRLREGDRAWFPVGVTGLTAVLLIVTGVDLARDLSRDDWVDYEPMATLIEAEVPADQVVYFDNLVPVGSYRAGYAGRSRFLEPGRDIPPAYVVVRNPTAARPDAGFVVALSGGHEVSVDGWSGERASPAMYLYRPVEPQAGFERAGHALISFGRAADPEDGVMLRLAGASLLAASGDPEAACAEVLAVRDDVPDQIDAVQEVLRGSPLADQIEVCLSAA